MYMAKKLTLETLAQMIKHGFDQTATKDDVVGLTRRADGLEVKIGGLEQKVGSLEQKVGSLEQKVGSLEQKMDEGFYAVNRRIDLLHDDLSDIPDIREEVKEHDLRIGRLERKAGTAR